MAHRTKCSNSSAVKTLLRRCFDASQVCVFHDSFKAKGALLRASALVISLATSLVKIESIWNQTLVTTALWGLLRTWYLLERVLLPCRSSTLRLLVVLASSSSVVPLLEWWWIVPLHCHGRRRGAIVLFAALAPVELSRIFKSMVGKKICLR
jgi:hypothetical protein